jgi:hypothetical protein
LQTEEGKIGEGEVEGICFSLTYETKQRDLTGLPAVALLNN